MRLLLCTSNQYRHDLVSSLPIHHFCLQFSICPAFPTIGLEMSLHFYPSSGVQYTASILTFVLYIFPPHGFFFNGLGLIERTQLQYNRISMVLFLAYFFLYILSDANSVPNYIKGYISTCWATTHLTRKTCDTVSFNF